ncbi:hypothetical protein [Kitasatospora sp. NPDC097691]|uniref:lipopolysaccharide biosynthesis protein n=1 Tax=Kitasatospora sp. NPDC097691 TaxID=3157231 RepID=UPI00332BF1D2
MSGVLGRLTRALPPGLLAVGVGTVTLGVASYAHLAVAGHALDRESLAEVSVLWTMAMSFALGLFFPVEQELTRVIAARAARDEGAAPVLRKAAVLTGGLLLAVLAGLGVFSRQLADVFFHGDRSLVVALAAAFVGPAACYLTRGVLAGLGHFGAYGLQLGLDGVLRIVFSVGLLVAGVHSALAYSLILAVSPVLAMLVSLPRTLRIALPGPTIGWRELCSGLGMLTVSFLLAQFVANAAVLSIQVLAPSQAVLVGAFTGAMVLSRVPLFVFGALQASLMSGLSTAVATGDRVGFRKLLTKTCGMVAALGVLGGVPAVVLGPWVIHVAFNADRHALGPVDFLWLSVGTLAYLLATVVGQAVIARGHHRRQLLGWALGTATLLLVTCLPGAPATRVEAAYTVGPLVVLAVMLLALRGDGSVRGAGTDTAQVTVSPDAVSAS